jgi:hypothetical protein
VKVGQTIRIDDFLGLRFWGGDLATKLPPSMTPHLKN